jgi:hypothetical protein
MEEASKYEVPRVYASRVKRWLILIEAVLALDEIKYENLI